MRPRPPFSNYVKFLVVAVAIMVLVDRLMPPRSVTPERTPPERTSAQEQIAVPAPVFMPDPMPEVTIHDWAEIEAPVPEEEMAAETIAAGLARWQEYAVPVVIDPDKDQVVIIIDDLGMDRRRSREIIALPGPLTLAYLPYAAGLDALEVEGVDYGHEIMIHMPMEPMNPDLDMGTIALRVDMAEDEFSEQMQAGLGALRRHVGMNNHMGSRLTRDPDAMVRVMAVMKEQGMLFVDSLTIHDSVAAQVAAEYGVPYAVRDVFLDDDPSLEAVRASLERLEDAARSRGMAIAIGHPKDNTIQALEQWLPTLDDKNLQLVPVSAVVTTVAADEADEL